MKMKKMMTVLLAGAMAAGLIACGGSSAPASADSADAGTGEAAAAADAGELTWKIGQIGPLSGDLAIYGSDVMGGGQIAVDEINAAGGINGYQIEYKSEDDMGDGATAINAYNTLKDWGMQRTMSCVTSTPTIKIGPETAADNMFQLTPSGSAIDCIKEDNAFAVCFNDPQQGTKSAEYIAAHMPEKVIATIYDSSDTYSSGIEATFEAKAAELGLNIVEKQAFTAETSTDLSAQIQKAKEAGADLVFLPIYYKTAATILTQCNNIGYKPTFFGCDGMDGILEVKNFDTSLAEGLMLLTPFAADAADEKTQNFVAKFEEAYGHVPNQFGADAYDGIYAIKAAIEQANLTPDMSVSDICEGMKPAMTEITVEGLTGTITWKATGEPDKEPKAVVIEGGKYVSIED